MLFADADSVSPINVAALGPAGYCNSFAAGRYRFSLQHSQGGATQASLESLGELVKEGPSLAGNTLQTFLNDTFDKVRRVCIMHLHYCVLTYVCTYLWC